MPSAVEMRTDISAKELRGLAKRSKDTKQARRLLSLAAVADGMSREEAARIGGMDPGSSPGPDAARLGSPVQQPWTGRLAGRSWGGPAARLSGEQKNELAALVEAGPELERDGVARWRQIDLQRVIKTRFGVDYDVRYVGKLLHQMGFSHLSPRPRHPGQDAETIASFKKPSAQR
jgi:transposase